MTLRQWWKWRKYQVIVFRSGTVVLFPKGKAIEFEMHAEGSGGGSNERRS